MSLWKLPFLLAATLGIHAGFTPPQPIPTTHEIDKYGPRSPSGAACEAVPNVGTWGPKSMKILITGVSTWEAILILSPSLPFLPHPSTPPPLFLTPTYILGTLLILLGAHIRAHCFRLLGRHFTFQLSIQPDHKLIKVGPYGIVRHPSYSAALMQVIGLLFCLTSGGSWWREYGVWSSGGFSSPSVGGGEGAGLHLFGQIFGKTLALIVFLQMVLCIGGGIDRCFREDRVMRDTFGKEWDEWAGKVRWRMIPGVF